MNIAKYILSKSGTDVNYDPGIKFLNPTFIFKRHFFVNEKLFKSIMKIGYRHFNYLLMYCIFDEIFLDQPFKYYKIIYNQIYFNNQFILKLLCYYKNQIIISHESFNQFILTEKRKRN